MSLADFCLSLADKIPTDFHSQMLCGHLFPQFFFIVSIVIKYYVFYNSQCRLFLHILECFYFNDNLFIMVLSQVYSFLSHIVLIFPRVFFFSIYLFHLPIYFYKHFCIIIFYFKYLKVLIFLFSVLADIPSWC